MYINKEIKLAKNHYLIHNQSYFNSNIISFFIVKKIGGLHGIYLTKYNI